MANNLVEYILTVDSDGAVAGLKKVEKEAEKAEDQLDKTGKEGQKAGSKMTAAFKKMGVAAAAGAAAIAGAAFAVVKLASAAKDFTIEAVDMVNDLGDIGNRSGTAAETIGALKAAFVASGQSASAVVGVLDVTAKRFAMLSKGSKEAEDSFKKYGIAIKDENGNLRSNNDLLLDSMKVIQGFSETSLRSRASLELLGRGGQQLSQALGAGNFDKFLEFVNEFGAVAGPKAAKSAALVQDSISLLEVAQEGYREELVMSLSLMDRVTTSNKMMMAFFAGLKEAINVNKKLINELFDNLISLANQMMKAFIFITTMGFEPANEGLQGMIENVFLVGASIIRFLIKPLIVVTAHLQLVSGLFSEDLSNAAGTATESLANFHKALDPNENRGFRTFSAFSVGVAKSLKLFQEITSSSATSTNNLDDALEEAADAAQNAADKIDHLTESANILNRVLAKLGVPRGLQFGGIKEATAQVEQLTQGLFEMGKQGAFSTGRKNQGSAQGGLDVMAQNVATALNIAAPQIGAAIAVTSGLVQLAEKLGGMGNNIAEIKNELTKSIADRAAVIEQGLQSLPEILNDVLPHIVQVMADAIIFGIAKAIAENINMLLTGLRQVLTKEGRQERRRERREGVTIGDRFGEFFRRMGVLGDIAFEGMRAGGRIPSARSGLNFTGQNAGLALLHKNEFVVPESGQAPQSVKRAMGGMGGSVNIVVNAQVVEQNAVDELVRQIERRFRTFGQSTSPLFGS